MKAEPARYFVSRQAQCMILPLWRKGMDTVDIGRALALPEHVIANLLFQLREQRKAENA